METQVGFIMSVLLGVFATSIYVNTIAFSRLYLAFDQNRHRYILYFSLLGSCVLLVLMTSHVIIACILLILIDLILVMLFNIHSKPQSIIQKGLSISLFLDMILLVKVSLPMTLSFIPLNILFSLMIIDKAYLFPWNRWFIKTIDYPTPVSCILHGGIISMPFFLMSKSFSFVNFDEIKTFLYLVLVSTSFLSQRDIDRQLDFKSKLIRSTQFQMSFALITYIYFSKTLAMMHVIWHGITKTYLFMSSNEMLEREQHKHALKAFDIQWIRSPIIGITSIFIYIVLIFELNHLITIMSQTNETNHNMDPYYLIYLILTAMISLLMALKQNTNLTLFNSLSSVKGS